MSASSVTVLDLAISVVLLGTLIFLVVSHRRQHRAIVDADAELSRTDERFRRLADSSPVGIFELDAEGRRIYTNPRVLANSRGGGSASTTDPYGSLPIPWHLPEEDVEIRMAEWRDATGAKRPISGRWRMRCDDGDLRWVRFDAAPLITDGEVT